MRLPTRISTSAAFATVVLFSAFTPPAFAGADGWACDRPTLCLHESASGDGDYVNVLADIADTTQSDRAGQARGAYNAGAVAWCLYPRTHFQGTGFQVDPGEAVALPSALQGSVGSLRSGSC
ncbi:peptidase inhibitor family I36 protein [Streptomyces sp. SID3343]|uniref:peptidase inhibitor family I36 protein n=1 Tax=Streptomyces sp. SID3343 TaxID=2690260 RepID=UPI00136D54B6|nr:peptidase inhibitor family I36 protein [Streptomyces sp. SID3343]MYW03399.1 hypothetical protein [Streptomyces sp. SID3343]